jgi:hypothetical protein
MEKEKKTRSKRPRSEAGEDEGQPEWLKNLTKEELSLRNWRLKCPEMVNRVPDELLHLIPDGLPLAYLGETIQVSQMIATTGNGIL